MKLIKILLILGTFALNFQAHATAGITCPGMTQTTCAKQVRTGYFRGVSKEDYTQVRCGEIYPMFLPALPSNCVAHGSYDPCSAARETAHAEAQAACQATYGNRCHFCAEYKFDRVARPYGGNSCEYAVDYSPYCGKPR